MSLIATYFFIRCNTKSWLFTLIATSLNGFLYWKKGIYADMFLETGYFLSACYGWMTWKKQPLQGNKPIQNLNIKQWFLIIFLIICIYLLIKFLLITFTHSSMAITDAITTTLSIIAQGLMCHKVIETWAIWLLADLLYAYMYFEKQLPFHFLLMLFFSGMAFFGFWNWIKMKKTF